MQCLKIFLTRGKVGALETKVERVDIISGKKNLKKGQTKEGDAQSEHKQQHGTQRKQDNSQVQPKAAAAAKLKLAMCVAKGLGWQTGQSQTREKLYEWESHQHAPNIFSTKVGLVACLSIFFFLFFFGGGG